MGLAQIRTVIGGMTISISNRSSSSKKYIVVTKVQTVCKTYFFELNSITFNTYGRVFFWYLTYQTPGHSLKRSKCRFDQVKHFECSTCREQVKVKSYNMADNSAISQTEMRKTSYMSLLWKWNLEAKLSWQREEQCLKSCIAGLRKSI